MEARRPFGIAALCTVALALVACGDDGTSSNGASSSLEPTTPYTDPCAFLDKKDVQTILHQADDASLDELPQDRGVWLEDCLWTSTSGDVQLAIYGATSSEGQRRLAKLLPLGPMFTSRAVRGIGDRATYWEDRTANKATTPTLGLTALKGSHVVNIVADLVNPKPTEAELERLMRKVLARL